MADPVLTSVALALPECLWALKHVRHLINELLLPETIDAAVYNDLAHVLHVYGASRRWTVKAMDGAAAKGRLDLVTRLHETRSEGLELLLDQREDTPLDFRSALRGAAANGHVKVVRLLHEHCTPEDISAALDKAGAHHHSGVLEVLLIERRTYKQGRVVWADRSRDSYYTSYHRDQYYVSYGLEAIAASGNERITRLMLRERFSASSIERALEKASANGHVEVVKRILGRGCTPCSIGRGLEKAAANGRVQLVKLLRDRCSPADVGSVLKAAVARGNVKVASEILAGCQHNVYTKSLVAKMAVQSRRKRTTRKLTRMAPLPSGAAQESPSSQTAEDFPASMSTNSESLVAPSLFVFGSALATNQ
ncbi:hypothetical protein BBJ28_00008519 [Nothophytophthora sp. Chile5]|nr:hypothetical protein BBJ28_00008519 [Nothophytophthora sp. Chile5]